MLIKRFGILFIIIICGLLLTVSASANNITVNNVELKNLLQVSPTAEIEFDISWET